MTIFRFPLNAPGDFYVLNESCIGCEAPVHEAPGLMTHAEQEGLYYHCYFYRQPATPEEVDDAIAAVQVSCCGAIRYGGRDPEVLKRLVSLGAKHACDLAE